MIGRNSTAHGCCRQPQGEPSTAIGLGLGAELCVDGAALIRHQKHAAAIGRGVEHVVVVIVIPAGRRAVDAAHLGDFLLGQRPDAVDIRTAEAVAEHARTIVAGGLVHAL